MNLLELVERQQIFADGAMGTMLQAAGLRGGRSPEQWNIERPDAVRAVHEAYAHAGANLLTANTFGANALRQRRSKYSVAALAEAGIRLAREIADAAAQPCFAALDVGPLGAFLEPLGTVSFAQAAAYFREPIEAAAAWADCILIETMSDVREASAAVQAARESCALPVFVTMSFDEKGRLLSGATLEEALDALSPLGIAGFGCNCGIGPSQMLDHLRRLSARTNLPLIISPNAGLPRYQDGETVYDLTPEVFAGHMRAIAAGGARVLGGCCGTTPAHIRAMIAAVTED